MANFFYYDANGQKQGAFTPQQLKALVTQGVINPQTPMETDTGKKGLAGQIPGLFAAPIQPTAQPQPVPQNAPIPVVEEPKKSRNSIPILVGIGVIVLVLIGGIWATTANRGEVKVFCDMYGSDVKAVDNDGKTLLHKVAKRDVAVAKFLISRGANVNAENEKGWTPLHSVAAETTPTNRGDVAVVKLLVSAGANMNAKTNDGMTPLHMAANSGDIAVVKFLVSKGADVNAKTHGGTTPLDLAKGVAERRENGKAIIKYLESMGAK